MSLQLSRLFEEFLGDPKKHSESKGQISFDCPACSNEKGMPEGDGKGNLEINYNRGVFKCWACAETNHMKGGIPFLIRRYADDRLLNKYFELKPEAAEFDRMYSHTHKLKLPKEYKAIPKCKKTEPKLGESKRYLRGRKISEKMIKRFDIGVCSTGEYHSRIVIPSYDKYGEVNYFVSRGINDFVWPKYMNPETDKEELIFNERFLNYDSTIYIVEGVFDHLVIPNSVPLLGKFMTEKFKHLLLTKCKANVVILLDDDAYDDAVRLYKDLNVGDLYNKVKLCIPPNGYDPSLMYEKFGYKGILKLLRSAKKMQESEIY
jgi:hypothetical protein